MSIFETVWVSWNTLLLFTPCTSEMVKAKFMPERQQQIPRISAGNGQLDSRYSNATRGTAMSLMALFI